MIASKVRGSAWLWITLAAIAAAIVWTHASVLSAGFRYDDYLVIRPWTPDERLRVLTGSWGDNDPYHRPLTALYQSALHPLFGYNARAMHALSLIELGLVAAGLAAFVSRELRRPAAGALAAIVLIVHPMLPDSTSAWIWNQMGLLADLLLVVALLDWQRARTGRARGWWLVWTACAASFYVKEDGAMVIPALLTMQWWRARWLGDVPMPSRSLVLSGAGVLLALAIVRLVVFPAAAPWPPSMDAAGFYLRNLLIGPFHVLLRLPGDSLIGAAGNIGVVMALAVAVGIAWRDRPRTSAAALFVSGAILMTWLGAPLLFVGGLTRSHLITFSAALMISAAMVIVHDRWPSRVVRRAIIAAALVTLLSMSLASREMNAHYAPCARQTLELDDVVITLEGVLPELRAWVSGKRAACEAGNYEPLPVDFPVSQAGR